MKLRISSSGGGFFPRNAEFAASWHVSPLARMPEKGYNSNIRNREDENMGFSGFYPEGLDLLIENRLMNSKPFYEEHKEKIKTLVQRPMAELIGEMAETMLEIDPLFVMVPSKMISRVRRDTRFTRDKTLYRDHAWCTFSRPKHEHDSRPCFYFEVMPESWGYGSGYYKATPAEMNLLREMILREDARFLAAFEAVNRSEKFSLYGEEFKRPKYPDAKPAYQTWLNRKNIGVSYSCYDYEPLFAGTFVEEMLHDLKEIAPFYHFLCAVYETARAESGAGR